MSNTDETLSIRTPEDVNTAANIAGIAPSNIPIQLLQFTTLSDSEDIQLLQMTNEIIESLKNGERVVIKGYHSDDAVLCTEDGTYDLRISKTSNSMLLCPDLLYPNNDNNDYENISNNITNKKVIGTVTSILEVSKCRPKLERLKQLLLENPYNGELNEQESVGQKYCLSDLLLVVQASESEIINGLKEQQACLINGYWRVFHVDYRDELFQNILTLLEEQDWSWHCIPLDECCNKLSELHPSFAIKHCLDCYGVSHDDIDTGGVVYDLIEEKVCQFFAEILLRPAGRFNYSEFIECWQQLVPMEMSTDLKQLKGLALKDTKAMPPVIWYFPVDRLPIEPLERFHTLFKAKETWTHEELVPYMTDLAMTTASLNTLLLKYTRISTGTDGVKIYYPKTTAH